MGYGEKYTGSEKLCQTLGDDLMSQAGQMYPICGDGPITQPPGFLAQEVMEGQETAGKDIS